MADRQFVLGGVEAAPADWLLPASLEIVPKTAYAVFDGTNAAGAFLPCLEIISDSGHVVGYYRTEESVAAGGSAIVSWFPGGELDTQTQDQAGGGGAPSGPAGGDLAGTYPHPTVTAIAETSGPTQLAIGAIPDGEFLQRSGEAVIGVASSASVAVTDGATTVAGASEVNFTSGAAVSSGGAGIADVAITAAAAGFSGARIYSSVDMSVPDTTDFTQTFDTVQFDVGGYANLGVHNTRLTAPVTGYYQMGACIAFPVGNYYTQLYVYVNGVRADAAATLVTSAPTAGTNPDLSVHAIYKLTAGDYIELGLVQEAGSAKNSLSAPPTVPSMWIALIGV